MLDSPFLMTCLSASPLEVKVTLMRFFLSMFLALFRRPCFSILISMPDTECGSLRSILEILAGITSLPIASIRNNISAEVADRFWAAISFP